MKKRHMKDALGEANSASLRVEREMSQAWVSNQERI